jgi:hypothetical protein
VAARVRADYEGRLRTLVDRLGAHRDAVREDVDRRRDTLRLAHESREHAQDELAEARLRNRLGEWSGSEWEARREELERAARAAQESVEEASAQLARGEALLAEIDPGAPAAQVSPPTPPEDDYSFLDGVDRALAAPTEAPEPDTRPTPGIKCPDCGYTNDSTAWFCGVCGLSLA